MTDEEKTNGSEPNQNEYLNKDTEDYVRHLKETQALKRTIEEKEKEITAVKSQNYDFVKKIESLEAEIRELKKGSSLQASTASSPANGRRASVISRALRRPAKRKVSRAKPPDPNKLSPEAAVTKDSSKEDGFVDPDKMYQEIAEKFPELPLATILMAEKKFVAADINRDGTIDVEELEKLLDSSVGLFTKEQVIEIFNTVDTDQTNTIDFMECLKVADLLRRNKKSGVPQTIIQNSKSSICSIQ